MIKIGVWLVVCAYEAGTLNPVTKRRGRWRVVSSTWAGLQHRASAYRITDGLVITAIRQYPKGSYIVPHRALSKTMAVIRHVNVVLQYFKIH